MVLKRSKAHKKLAKKAAQALAPVAEKPYLPPSRDSLDPVEWVELFDGIGFRVYAWYFKKTSKASLRKLADFHIQALQIFPGGDISAGVLVASADCLNHGTLHFHNEIKDPQHLERKDVMTLNSPMDVEVAFVHVYDKLLEYAGTIISRRSVE